MASGSVRCVRSDGRLRVVYCTVWCGPTRCDLRLSPKYPDTKYISASGQQNAVWFIPRETV